MATQPHQHGSSVNEQSAKSSSRKDAGRLGDGRRRDTGNIGQPADQKQPYTNSAEGLPLSNATEAAAAAASHRRGDLECIEQEAARIDETSDYAAVASSAKNTPRHPPATSPDIKHTPTCGVLHAPQAQPLRNTSDEEPKVGSVREPYVFSEIFSEGDDEHGNLRFLFSTFSYIPDQRVAYFGQSKLRKYHLTISHIMESLELVSRYRQQDRVVILISGNQQGPSKKTQIKHFIVCHQPELGLITLSSSD